MSSSPPRVCPVCDEQTSAVVFKEDLIKSVSIQKQEKVAKTLEPFLQHVNAILNSIGGAAEEAASLHQIWLHTEVPHLLGEFDKRLDLHLVKLISNDSFFHEYFRRYFHDDRHVVFEIHPKHNNHSSLEFSTKVSLNRGLREPTRLQMKRLIEGDHQTASHFITKNKITTFVHPGHQMMAVVENHENQVVTENQVPFQESFNVQAKPSSDKYRTQNSRNRAIKHVQWWCKKQKLLEYISAFAKIHGGGSIYLGVKEEMDNFRQTGFFTSNGMILNESDRDDMDREIRNAIETKMIWLPQDVLRKPEEILSTINQSSQTKPIDIKFHPVENGERDEYVLEVRVKHFLGLSFYNDGPRSYRFENDREQSLSKFILYDWIEKMKEQNGRQMSRAVPSTSVASTSTSIASTSTLVANTSANTSTLVASTSTSTRTSV